MPELATQEALPSNIDIASARLPATYEQAKTALASCERIDECQEWANKAEALSAYARMAEDDSLRVLADRIQARAVRRMGELLKQFDARPDNARKQKEGDLPLIPQKAAAERAGISEHQRKQAVRVANVPQDQFESAIEGPKPATVTQLAEMGKVERPKGFDEATHLIGTVTRFAEFCAANDPTLVAGGLLSHEVQELKQQVATIDGWLDRFVVALQGAT